MSSWAFEIELIGWPSGYLPGHKDSQLSKLDALAFSGMFGSSQDGASEHNRVGRNPTDRELGRLRLAAFAFDSSIATLGAPLGRVPKRKDK